MMTEIEKYIAAILDLIYKKEDLEQISFDLSLFGDHIGYNSIVRSSGNELEKRKYLVESNLDVIESKVLLDYFKGLLSKGDLWIFEPSHFKMFCQEMESASKKTIYFNLTTAIELKDEDLRGLSQRLSKKMEKKVLVHLAVDKSIIGGAIIRKDNYILDYSLKTKLSSLAVQWKKSIQKA